MERRGTSLDRTRSQWNRRSTSAWRTAATAQRRWAPRPWTASSASGFAPSSRNGQQTRAADPCESVLFRGGLPAATFRRTPAPKSVAEFVAGAALAKDVDAARRHRRVPFGDERAVAETGVRPRQPGHLRQFARHGHPGVRKEAARDLAKRHAAADAPAQLVRKPAHCERPDIGELRLVVHLARDDQH